MSDVRFDRNQGFERELEAAPEMVTFIEAATKIVAVSVKANSPRGDGPKGGYYQRRIRARGNRVVATDFFWFLVEYGSVNNRAYAPLRIGTRAAGLRLDTNHI